MKRGEIYYIHKAPTTGCEIKTEKARPAIIVSCDALNAHSGVVEVVFLTTKPKKDMPTHVTVNCKGTQSTALCEQISSASVERVGDRCGVCTPEEMQAVEKAMLASLAINVDVNVVNVVNICAGTEPLTDAEADLIRAVTERDVYERIASKLIDKAVL